ncbi:MAG: transporter [Armatimonadetes bacterium]|nr:transporter [Armatimonadota bacterium]
MKQPLVVSLIALAALSAVAAHATPWFTQDPRTLPDGWWRVEEHFMYSGIDHGLADGETAPLPGGVTNASAITAHTRIRYGARDDLTVFVDIPWVRKEAHTAAGTLDNDGLGDLQFLAKWKYRENKEQGWRRALAAFTKLDTGDTEGLPPLLATGSGQNDFGLTHLWEWRHAGSTWYASTGYVFRDTRDDTGVDPGDWIVLNLAAEHPIGDSHANFVCELNGRREARSRQGGQSLANSGATIFSLTPGVQYVDKKPNGRSITWEAGVQIPVFQHGNLPAIPDYTVYAGGYAIF